MDKCTFMTVCDASKVTSIKSDSVIIRFDALEVPRSDRTKHLFKDVDNSTIDYGQWLNRNASRVDRLVV